MTCFCRKAQGYIFIAFHIKSILEKCGLFYLWQHQFDMPINYNLVKQRILDIYHQTWYTEINNSRRLETYALFKHSFEFEQYLDIIKEPKFRIALTRFRVSSHDLAIERGRYTNIPREERICTNCNLNILENEFHFVMTCRKHSELRSKYVKRYYYTWPTMQKFTSLLSDISKMKVINLSKFIYFANLQRL